MKDLVVYICRVKGSAIISAIFTTEEAAKKHVEKVGGVVEPWTVFETDERFRYTEDGGMYVI